VLFCSLLQHCVYQILCTDVPVCSSVAEGYDFSVSNFLKTSRKVAFSPTSPEPADNSCRHIWSSTGAVIINNLRTLLLRQPSLQPSFPEPLPDENWHYIEAQTVSRIINNLAGPIASTSANRLFNIQSRNLLNRLHKRQPSHRSKFESTEYSNVLLQIILTSEVECTAFKVPFTLRLLYH
jgi:hypothetical protein